MNTLQRGGSSGIVVALIIIILLVVGIIFFTGDETTDEGMMEENEETEEMEEMENTVQSGAAILTALGESGVSGGAAFLVDSNNTAVQVVLEGTTEDVAHPAHVHMGTCEELGEVVYPLNDVVGGESTTLLEGFDVSDGDYVVNVHASAEDLDTSVACGQVMFQSDDSGDMEGSDGDEEMGMEDEEVTEGDTGAEESSMDDAGTETSEDSI